MVLSRGDAHLLRGGDPSPSHRLVQIDQRLEERTLGLPVGKLGVEEAPLGVEHLDVARVAVIVAEPRHLRIALQ